MANPEKKDFVIPNTYVEFATSYVCREGIDLCFCGDPVPAEKGKVLISLRGSSLALHCFNQDIARNFS